MYSPFLALYQWFARRRWLLFTWLVVLLGAFGWMASQVRFDENISSFFGDQEDPQQRALFENLKVKDKLVVMFSGDDPDRLIEQADSFAMQLQPLQFAKQVMDPAALKALNIMDCMECRCCEYICSSKIPLVNLIKIGKNAVRGMK